MTEREIIIEGLERRQRFKTPDGSSCVIPANLLQDALALLKAQEPITGETSDGYHTFNELYHHRAVLFSVIVANYPDRAWKSKKHHDGTMYNGMFIVGIDTPDGQATYHYDVDPYWDMFECRVLDNSPEWDGHTPAQAIERIGKLKAPTVGGWTSVKDRLPEIGERVLVFGVGKYEHFVGSTMTAITCMSDANLIDCRLKTQPYWLEPWQYYLTDYEITHWMPLPEPPKEDNDAGQ